MSSNEQVLPAPTDLKTALSSCYAGGCGVILATTLHDYIYEVTPASADACPAILHRDWDSFVLSIARSSFGGRLIRYDPWIGLRCEGQAHRVTEHADNAVPLGDVLRQTSSAMLPGDTSRDQHDLPLALIESCAVIVEALRSLADPVLVSLNVDIQSTRQGSERQQAEALAQLLGHASRMLWMGGVDDAARGAGHLILVSYSGVFEPLYSGRDLAAPIGEVRQPAAPIEALELLLDQRCDRLEDGASNVRVFSQLAKGASLSRLDMALNACESAGRLLARQDVFEVKRQGILDRTAGCLEPVQTTKHLADIAGYANAKALLQRVVQQYRHNPLNRDNVRGVLLAGPPGTGKSHIAEAVASESGLPFFRFGNFRNSLMGESERRLELVLDTLREQGPAVVWIDEADSEFPRPSDTFYGNNTEASLINRLKQFIGNPDHSAGILFIMATNYPERLDPAMVRAGRVGLVLPLLCPAKHERDEIIALLCSQLGLDFSAELQRQLVVLTDAYSGADIRTLLLNLREEQQAYSADEAELLRYASLSRASVSHGDMLEMSRQAVRMTNTPRALPWFDPATREFDASAMPAWLRHTAACETAVAATELTPLTQPPATAVPQAEPVRRRIR